MKIIKYCSFVTILGFGLLLINGCSKNEEKKAAVFPVETLIIKPTKIASYIKTGGSVDSKVHAVIQSPVIGSIDRLLVNDGSKTTRGQILCYIMPAEQQNLLGQAASEYSYMKQKYNNASEQEKVNLKAKYADALARYNSAKKLNKSVPVVSTITGSVLHKYIDTGSSVSVKTPLFEIADMNRMIIRTSVSERYAWKIKRGDIVNLEFDFDRGVIYKGTISTISPGINTETRTADVEISLTDLMGIRPGMTAQITFVLDKKNNVLTVPADSIIIKPDGSKFVFSVVSNTAKENKIKTGIESNDEVEITSGLNEGDIVVINGQENLKNKAPVKNLSVKPEKGGKQ